MTKKPSANKCNIPPESRAGKGNQRGVKLKDPDVRQEAFKQYCDHLAQGNPRESFFFDHPTHSVTWETMESYIEKYPNEFSPILIKKAKSARYQYWFNEGKTLMQGGYKCGSPVVWQTIMRNMFRNEIGWDREQIAQDNKTHVERLATQIRSEAVPDAEIGDSAIEQEN